MSAARPPGIRGFLIALLVVYCAKQVVTAVLFPPFTGHDEVAHYEYVRVLALEGRIPTLYGDRLPGRLFEYRRYALQWRELGQWDTPLYTAVHPPLYYAAMVPVYRAGRALPPVGKQYLLRLAAIPFGLVTVILAWLMVRRIFPEDVFLAVTVPTIVAFQPQISYAAAMVNNDIVAIACFSWLLYLLVVVVREGVTWGRAVLVGVAFGLGLLAKSSVAAALPVVVAAFWLAPAQRTRRFGMLVLAGAVTFAFIAPWQAFVYRTYGDLTGLRALSELQTGLTRSDMGFLQLLFSGEFAATLWKETWGEFGWRLIPIDSRLVSLTAVVALAALFGLAGYVMAHRPAGARESGSALLRSQWHSLLLLALACVIMYFAVVQFGTMFLLAQARYFFPAVNAAALLAMLGLRAWIPPRWHDTAQVSIVFCCILLNAAIYTTHVVPYWYFR